MRISILTLFPEMFVSPFAQSIIRRAQEKKTVTIEYVNIRNFAYDSHKSVDDHPYGGGHGMVMRVDVIDRAIQSILSSSGSKKIVLLDPQGKSYTQTRAKELSMLDHLILVCGHYEGIDERVRGLVDEEISIGDYVLTGGEIPAMVVVDSVVRLLPKTLKKAEATVDESFTERLLEYPQYTRPETHKGNSVPKILLGGNHKQISEWRAQESIKRTKKRRPDLLRSK